MRDLYLAIDVGTGSLRAALVNDAGVIQALASQEHDQIVPQFGWSEQSPAAWWAGTKAVIKSVIGQVDGGADRVAAICACGQMHGTVLIDDAGWLTRETVPLWNDKRTASQVQAYLEKTPPDVWYDIAANAPSTAWPAFKLAWIAENEPDVMARSSTVLMPKDWINFCLTGQRAGDITEASLSFLMDWKSRTWSRDLCQTLGLSLDILPPLMNPSDVLGPLLPSVAADLGLSADIPVLVGAGDYPMALLGSGVTDPGMGSDVTGTSTIITLLHDTPLMDTGLSNVLSANGVWGAMTLLDAGGDAIRWARRAFHDNAHSYADLAETANRAVAGSNGLFFLPYLSGTRADPQSRAQFFGLTASHRMAELHRAVLEGVAFSVRQTLDQLDGGKGRPDRIVAASGGAKNALWIKIKASMYGVPYLVPRELECGIVGSAMLMSVATGASPDMATATKRMVHFDQEVLPDPAWVDTYDKMMPIYSQLCDAAKPIYAALDALD